jgi:hypothetical protein
VVAKDNVEAWRNSSKEDILFSEQQSVSKEDQKLPIILSKDPKEKMLYRLVSHQRKNFKNKIQIMKNDDL